MTTALDLVVRRLQMDVRNQDDIDLEACLDGMDVGAFLVQQEGGDVNRHLRVNGGAVLLHRLFLDDAQDVQGGGFGAADVASAVAARAGDVAAFTQARAQALTRQFHQAEARDLAHLHAGAVVMQRFTQAGFDFALVALAFHVDEVDDDQAAQVAQAQLAGDFVGRFEVGAEGRFLDVMAARGTGGVDVDGYQRFGVVDDDRAAGGQVDLARIRGFDLVLDLEAREQRHVVAVALHAGHVVRHDVRHEHLGLLEDRVRVDQDFADFRVEVIADGANDQAAFLINQERALLRVGGCFDGRPQLHQVVQVPLQFFVRPADAGGAGDDAHALLDRQLVHDVAEFVAVFTLDATRYAAAARIVRHQNQVTTGQADERGEGCPLVAALVLFDLDDQFLTFVQGVLDAGLAHVHTALEEGAGYFLEGEESVAVGAVIDEGCFEAGLDAGNDRLVDVALALLF